MTNLALNTQNSTPFNTTIITTNNTTITMTSLEIVDFINNHRKANGNDTELRHDHFMTKVPQVLGETTAPKFLGTVNYQSGQGAVSTRNVYNFPKREACLMAMSYSYDIQAEIYDRMTALEQHLVIQPQLPNFLDPAEAALAWAKQYKATKLAETQLLEAKQVIEVQQVDVDALERIANRKGSMTVRDAAKLLNMRPIDLRDWMLANKWTYSPYNGKFRPTASHATAGHLTLSANDYDPLVRVTWKGLALLAKRLNVTLDTDNI